MDGLLQCHSCAVLYSQLSPTQSLLVLLLLLLLLLLFIIIIIIIILLLLLLSALVPASGSSKFDNMNLLKIGGNMETISQKVINPFEGIIAGECLEQF